METVRDVMTPNPATVRSSDPVAVAARVMLDEDVGAVPVIDEGTVAGMITDRDIAIKVVAIGRDPQTAAVSEYMSTHVVTGRPDMSLDEAARLMGREQIRRLPIVDQNRLVGIVALGDLATEPRGQDEAEDALEEISQPAR
jgi:CBS domain-containing protein